MVRKVVNAILASFLATLVVCSPALATTEEDTSQPEQPATRVVDYSSRLDTIDQHVQDVSDTYTDGKTELVQHLLSIETLLKPVETVQPAETVEKEDEKSPETEQLEKVDETLKGIDKKLEGVTTVLETPVEQIEEQKALNATKATVNVIAYSNVPASGTYAEYAKGVLPRAEYGDHYCFVQDTSSSYLMAYGDLKQTGGSIAGPAKWVRWYYSGTNAGYVQEVGEGQISINPNNHVVMSDLGQYPMFESNELLRKEIGFYAVVAVVVFSLVSVLGFVVRLRGALAI